MNPLISLCVSVWLKLALIMQSIVFGLLMVDKTKSDDLKNETQNLSIETRALSTINNPIVLWYK